MAEVVTPGEADMAGHPGGTRMAAGGTPRPATTVVLFDLDGTLVDSAADLAATVNAMRRDRGHGALPLALLREHAGSGARGMLREAFRCGPRDPGYDALRDEFHERYAAVLLVHARPFEGVAAVLSRLGDAGLCWGIVTNKAMRFARPLVAAFAELGATAVLVAGDSTPHTKPHPAPLLEAARRLDVHPACCVYVGDDERDIAAGRAAGMRTAVAEWGYVGGSASPPGRWGADVLLPAPPTLLKWLEVA